MSVVIIVLLVCDMLHMYVYYMTCKEACDYCYCYVNSYYGSSSTPWLEWKHLLQVESGHC